MAWISPTGHETPTTWTNPANAYDNNTASYAVSDDINYGTWGDYLVLTLAGAYCDKIRHYSYGTSMAEVKKITQIDIDAYYDGAWHDIYEGVFSDDTWEEKLLESIKYVTKVRVRYYCDTFDDGGSFYNATCKEIQLSEKEIPTVTTTSPPSEKDHNSATVGGNVTEDNGLNITERGFEYKEGSEGEILTVSEEDEDFGEGAFSLEITGLEPNTEYYYRAYAVNSEGTGYGDWESFTTDKTTPTVTVSAPTDVLSTTVTANGNITATGGENCSERGFEYGLTKTPTWSVKNDAGGYGVGEFSKGLSSLSANTYYWIRAYAVNTIGTGYSEWIQFQTAAEGTIPTGTKINICSDYSGYTYKLMRSETDDGEEYTAYFVISTDLTNKRGLAYYKRILDLWLYFNKEDSGSANVYVKRDNEPDWQTVGTVTLTGTEDIVIKHLAPDIRGKHFLFKISASNHFEFLGALFEWPLEAMGMR